MSDIDWSSCPDVERVPGRVSGQWVVVGTRILADGVIENADVGLSPEEIGDDIFDGLVRPTGPPNHPVCQDARRAPDSARLNHLCACPILLDQNAPLGLRRALTEY